MRATQKTLNKLEAIQSEIMTKIGWSLDKPLFNRMHLKEKISLCNYYSKEGYGRTYSVELQFNRTVSITDRTPLDCFILNMSKEYYLNKEQYQEIKTNNA